MKTKADFQQAAADMISEYPTAARLYQARDPRLLAPLDAMATMLSMISSEVDTAAMEPFTKARDMTVLADAAVKGVMPFGESIKVRIAVANASTEPLPIANGQRLRDATGRLYSVTLGATIPPNGSGFIQVAQVSPRSYVHVVTVSKPFYEIQVDEPEIGFIESIGVSASNGSKFTYVVDFANVGDGERVFHLKTDESKIIYVQFGATGVVGYQPSVGESLTISVMDTEGDVQLAVGTLFSFEYSASVYEAGAKLSMSEVLAPGAAPMDIATTREVCSYPSTYDTNAVYLGNFDFLVRRNLSPFVFLSIWNEIREEAVRGPSIDNINRLFVAARKTGVLPIELQNQIAAIINRADDSYRLTFVDVVDEAVGLTVTIHTQSVYDFESVRQRARELLLSGYGIASPWAKRGDAKILYKDVYALLTADIQALQDRVSDMEMTVSLSSDSLPEVFRYVSDESLIVNVVELT